MGEELELGNLFVACDDGTYVPFEGFKPSDTVIVDEMDEKLYASLPKEGTIELGFDMKRRDNRKAMKMFKAQINGYRRRKRYAIRQKEYARRRKLKEGIYDMNDDKTFFYIQRGLVKSRFRALLEIYFLYQTGRLSFEDYLNFTGEALIRLFGQSEEFVEDWKEKTRKNQYT